jgi:hypothetical protein
MHALFSIQGWVYDYPEVCFKTILRLEPERLIKNFFLEGEQKSAN